MGEGNSRLADPMQGDSPPPALPGLWILASKLFYRNADPQAKLAEISCAPSSAGGNGFLFYLFAFF